MSTFLVIKNIYKALSKLFEPLKKKSQKICYFIIPKRSLCNNLTILSFYSSQKARKTHFLANFWQGGQTKVENILISEKNGWNFQES